MKSLKKNFKKLNKRKFYKASLVILQILLLLYYNIAVAFAQTPTISPPPATTTSSQTSPSPSPSNPEPSPVLSPGLFDEPTPTSIPTPTIIPTATSEPTLVPTFEPTSSPNLSNDSLSQNSAAIRKPIKSILVSKSVLNSAESVSIKIFNTASQNLKTEFFKNGKIINLFASQKISDDTVILTVDPPNSFEPGKYTVKITDSAGHVEQQDFIWGVLAINTNKPVYEKDETARLSFTVLDENGKMDCGAKLSLKITNGQLEDILSLENGKITKTEFCEMKTTSNTADFISDYKFTQSGKYNLELSAVTKNGNYSISDSISVVENNPFIIDRQFPSRINPGSPTSVSFSITAKNDFVGQIFEAVPDSFEIATNSATPYQSLQTVVSSKDMLLTGSDSPLIIGMPFSGSYPITLKYSEHLLDNLEKDIYARYGLLGHDGIDYALPEGTPLLAVDDGEIILAGAGAYGVTVVIQHTWGRSYYGHLQGTGMTIGDKVLKGHKIGISGKTGLATGPHLHFGMKFNSPDMNNGYFGKIDPLPFLTGSSIIPGFSAKLIGWKISLQKGQTKTFNYTFDAPDHSPQFYKLGPIRLYSESSYPQDNSNPFVLGIATLKNTKPDFVEERQWQIAVDAPPAPPPASAPSVLGNQSDQKLAEKSTITKGKIVDTNLKENEKAGDKLFRWEVKLPNKTVFGFGLQDKSDIKPIIRIRNLEGWYVEFEPNLVELPKVKPKVNGNQIEWEISPGITARYTALKDRIKADYIVNDKAALESLNSPAGETGRLPFKVRYNDIKVPDIPENANLTPEDMKDAGLMRHELMPDGSIVWLMESGMTAFEHPVPKIKDNAGTEFQGTYEINKNAQGLSYLSIILPQDKIDSSQFPLTIDPVTIDAGASATVTAYAQGRQILRDGFGNLIVVVEGGTGNDSIYTKDFNASSWTDEAIALGSAADATNQLSSDLDSSGNLHIAYFDDSAANTPISYQSYTVNRAADNTISSLSALTAQFNLDTTGSSRRPSLIIANKGEGSGKEKVAIAWASNTSKNPKQGEIRFLQCDVADGCDTAAEWKNASEAKNGNTDGLPSAGTTRGAADWLFTVASSTTHHGVLTQVPGRPARTPTTAYKFEDDTSTYTALTNAVDDNTGTNATIGGLTAGSNIYIGDDNTFSRVIVNLDTVASSITDQSGSYCSAVDGSNNCTTWTSVSNLLDNTDDGTTVYKEDGSILFDLPSNWVKSTGPSGSGLPLKYYMRTNLTVNTLTAGTTVAEFDVTDRHSHDLLIVGGPDSTDDLQSAYVIWDFIGAAGWENIPGNTTAPAPWREIATDASSIDDTGGNWGTFINFPLTITADYIKDTVYLSYVDDQASDVLYVLSITNKVSLTTASSWTNTSFPTVTEGTDIEFSLTSDQNDIYLFYILDPSTSNTDNRADLNYRKCQPNGGGNMDICDNSADWSSEITFYDDSSTIESTDHPQAVLSKAFGDTVAVDLIWTQANALDVFYERHLVNMADATEVITASGDDAYETDCDDDLLIDQSLTSTTVKLGRENDDANCTAGIVESENHVGFRFQTINIAPGTAISSAYLDFRVFTDAAGSAVDFTIYGHDNDNSAAFTSNSNCTRGVTCTDLIDERTKTTTSTVGSVNFETQSYRFDVTDMVQEIICRGAGSAQPCVGNYNGAGTWAANNDLSLLLISAEGGTTDNNALITAQDDTATVMLDPTLQINLGNSSKRYSMGVDLDSTSDKEDLDHPMETEEFTAVNTDDALIASVSASMVPSASSSAVPQFLFKVNNTNNNNTDDLSATAIVKSSLRTNTVGSHTGRSIYLQVYKGGVGWVTKDTETATGADTDITLSSGTISTATTHYSTESPGGSCSGSDCWTSWRVYQDEGPEGNQILYVDNFSLSFISPTPTSGAGPSVDQLLRHQGWFSSGVEQPFFL